VLLLKPGQNLRRYLKNKSINQMVIKNILYLASRSPRRRQLLEQIGVTYEVIDIEVDERWDGREPARAHALRLARAKALAGLAKRIDNTLPVLAADTVVTLDGDILGQPQTHEEGLAMLAKLSGRRHTVISAVALAGCNADDEPSLSVNSSTVDFRPTTAAEREAYWNSGEPLGKAGGYAIQGRAAQFIARIEGSYSGVMGLPLYETAELLRECGIVTALR
jgi:septum formation protein